MLGKTTKHRRSSSLSRYSHDAMPGCCALRREKSPPLADCADCATGPAAPAALRSVDDRLRSWICCVSCRRAWRRGCCGDGLMSDGFAICWACALSAILSGPLIYCSRRPCRPPTRRSSPPFLCWSHVLWYKFQLRILSQTLQLLPLRPYQDLNFSSL
jgi:hypothetical protein